MAKKAVSPDMAEKVLEQLEAEYGLMGSHSARAIVLDAIASGLISFDETESTVTYTLMKPVEMKNGETLQSITLREPDVSDIERMNKGIEAKGKADGSFTIDGDMRTRMTIRMVSILANVPVTLVQKVKRRDFQVFEALGDFFG